MNRLANPKDGGQYSFYYTVIQGWDAVANGTAKTVSGIETPNDSTIVFHLTKPVGDFNLRMSMPATAPIPEEVGKCFEGKPGDYGRDVVSSGPYMIQGADKVSIASCSALKPMSGYDGANGNHIILVRNPNYDQSTDAYRKNYIDTFKFVVNSNADDIFAKVQSGAYQDEVSSPAPKTIRLVRDQPGAQAADDPERRRPHELLHDEPDAGAVRRCPHPQGDELDHGQVGAAEGVGRPDPRLDRNARRPAGALQQRPRRVRPVRDAQRDGRRRQGGG